MKKLSLLILLFCTVSLHAMDLDDDLLRQVQQLSLQDAQQQEDQDLARAIRLSLNPQVNNQNTDEELARRLQEEFDRELAQRLVQAKITKSPEQQLREYRKRHQSRNRHNKTRINNSQQHLRNRQQPKYAQFDHDLGKQLTLPGVTGQLKLPGVYHVFSSALIPQQQQWACTFHALYNACKVEEQFLGKKIDDQLFINCCRLTALKPNISGKSFEVFSIAEQLKLSKWNCIHIEDNTILMIPRSGKILYEMIHYESPELAQLRARKQSTNKMFQECKKILNTPGKQCVHFIGGIISKNVPHAILISVIKQQDGSKALYIFDNMNNQEDQFAQAQIKMLAEHVHDQLMQ